MNIEYYRSRVIELMNEYQGAVSTMVIQSRLSKDIAADSSGSKNLNLAMEELIKDGIICIPNEERRHVIQLCKRDMHK